MRKSYQKPALFAETFELTEHIANCEGAYNQREYATRFKEGIGCQYYDPSTGERFFLAGGTACVGEGVTALPDGDYSTGFFDCYQGPGEQLATPFSS